jgi:formamidopyrimidine-DNA glycosylase
VPELPDLEVVSEVLSGRLTGGTIVWAAVLRPIVVRNLCGEDFSTRVVGQRVEAVTRQGKFLLLRLSMGDWLVLNPMLGGRLRLGAAGEKPRPGVFLALDLDNGVNVSYSDPHSMGKFYLTSSLELVPTFADMGPDALDPRLDLSAFVARLRPHRGEIKGILTKQKVVAGIGNAYADEILFSARLFPFRKRTSLSPEELGRLYCAMRSTLTEAVGILRERVGSDIHVEVRDFLQVHGRGGQPCPRCGLAISEIRARQQLTNFCRQCQPGTLVRT